MVIILKFSVEIFTYVLYVFAVNSINCNDAEVGSFNYY